MSECSFGDNIDIKPDGINSLDPCLYEEVQVVHNVTVSVLKCTRCGKVSIMWSRQPDSFDEFEPKNI